jgi:GNAT superfamily N-acetyltransferase
MVGNTDLFSYIDEEGNEKWEIAYDLDPDYWGKGLGGGMIGFLVQWAGWTGVWVVTAVGLSLYLTFVGLDFLPGKSEDGRDARRLTEIEGRIGQFCFAGRSEI